MIVPTAIAMNNSGWALIRKESELVLHVSNQDNAITLFFQSKTQNSAPTV